ncbi:reverse transcriptase-like protein [Bacillus sp. FJAT-45350]|uniref:reverse transcriptase-like protein n=1 Tax=Bacillus sp. FJAT-45350 TaxID=2011014 RepID=UPI000BB75B6D|nr:reverse transcriptase-like protein [Bacillus sp. FJAT-45350]
MIEISIDGASAGNPGPSGAGIFINYKNGQVDRHSIPLGEMSNHEAEFLALIHALDICIEKGITSVSFRTDSKLLDDAIEKQYVKKSLYQPLLEQVLERIKKFDMFFMKWIPSNQNKNADELSRQAIRKNDNTND